MTALLGQLITDALALAGDDSKVMHGGRLWKFEGGRSCPIDWHDCSQAVYRDLRTDAWDYGEPGGPGHADCVRTCPHGMQPPPDDELPSEGDQDRDAWLSEPDLPATEDGGAAGAESS
jgi:hypothetical protein